MLNILVFNYQKAKNISLRFTDNNFYQPLNLSSLSSELLLSLCALAINTAHSCLNIVVIPPSMAHFTKFQAPRLREQRDSGYRDQQ